MPGRQQRPDNPKHDASYKSFFTHPRTVADTLRAAAGDIARHLDFATLERMAASFVTEHLGQRHTDMLWRIGTTARGWVYILILLELQSTVDRRMALRMMDYTATIWMRLAREDLGPGGEYPFVLPVVIYNGERRWTAARSVADLLAPVPEALTLIERARKWGEERDQLWLRKGIEQGIDRKRALVHRMVSRRVRIRHRRTSLAGAGADLRAGGYRARCRRRDRKRDRRRVPSAGAGA